MKRELLRSMKKAWSVIRTEQGFSLVEVILTGSVFALILTALVGAYLYGQESSVLAGNRTRAVLLAEEGIEAVRNIRDENFANLTAGTHGLDISSNQWVFSGSSSSTDIFTRSVTIGDVNDTTKLVTSTVTWVQNAQRNGIVEIVTRLVNWLLSAWTQTTQSDFTAGSEDSVEVVSNSGGEVQLSLFGDWTDTSVLTTYNTDGTGNINDFDADSRRQILYSVANSTAGEEFTVLDISDVSSGNLTELGSVGFTFDINAVSVHNGYAYLATDDNSQELVVIRLSDYTQVNSYDTPSGSNGFAVYATGTTAYIGPSSSGSEDFYVLDITSPESTISELAALEIGESVRGIDADTSYVYLATEANSQELTIIRRSDNTQVNTLDISGNADMFGIDVYNNTAYLVRDSSSEAEVYAVDVSSPESSLSVSNSFEVGSDANGIFAANNGNLYVATDDNSKELVVLNASTFIEVGSADTSSGSNADAVYFLGAYARTSGGGSGARI